MILGNSFQTLQPSALVTPPVQQKDLLCTTGGGGKCGHCNHCSNIDAEFFTDISIGRRFNINYQL